MKIQDRSTYHDMHQPILWEDMFWQYNLELFSDTFIFFTFKELIEALSKPLSHGIFDARLEEIFIEI